MDKIKLSAILSRLKTPETHSLKFEQYPTDIKTAVDFLTFVDETSGFKGKNVADFGSGNGILGIGAAVLGAKHADLYDIDVKMADLSSRNIADLNLDNCDSHHEDFFDVEGRYDIVISNPPFGFQSSFRIDAFVGKLGDISDEFFFIYKKNKEMENLAQKTGLNVTYLGELRIPRIARFHKKESESIPVCIVYRCASVK